MRPDKWKKKRSRNYEKSQSGTSQEKKVDEKNDSKPENESNVQKEAEKEQACTSKTANNEDVAGKDKSETPPIPNLRRETDDLKETKKFSKRQIFSNWDKYDEPIVPEEEDEIHDDFGMLIQRHFSGDEHFKFKFQQEWESESCNINQDLFTLNLERLSSGLSCIPYYKRLNLPTELFSEDEIQRMHNEAKAKEVDYEKLLKGEPPEPISASLIGKLKECLNDQTKVDETLMNSDEEDAEVAMLDIGTFAMEVGSKDDVWNTNQNESKTQLTEEKEIPAKVSDEKILKTEWSETKEKEDKVIEVKMEASEENREILNLDKVETYEVEKEQRKKRPSNRRREAENKSSDKMGQSHDSSTNVTKKDPQRTDENVVLTENVVKKAEPEKIPEVTLPPKAKNSPSNTVSKSAALEEDAEGFDSLLSLKKPAVSQFGKNKIKVEDDDVLDSLLSLKEPSLPQYDLCHKVEEEEHEVESLVTNVSSIVIHEKKENLEEWLDSMLDD